MRCTPETRREPDVVRKPPPTLYIHHAPGPRAGHGARHGRSGLGAGCRHAAGRRQGHRTGPHRGHRFQHQAHRCRNRLAGADHQPPGHREHGRPHAVAGAGQPAGRAPRAAGLQVAVHRLGRRFAGQPARHGRAGHAGAVEWPPPVVLRRAGGLPDPVRQHRRDSRRGDRADGSADRRRLGRVRHRRDRRRHQRHHQEVLPGPGGQPDHRQLLAHHQLRRAPGQHHRRLRQSRRGSLQRVRLAEPVPARPDPAERLVRQEARPVLRQQPELHQQFPPGHRQCAGHAQSRQLLCLRSGHRRARAGSRAGLPERGHRSRGSALHLADLDEQRD